MNEKLVKKNKSKDQNIDDTSLTISELMKDDEETKSKRRRKRRSHEPDNLTDSQLKAELSKLETENPIERIPDGRRQRVRIEDSPYHVEKWFEELKKAYSDEGTKVFEKKVVSATLVQPHAEREAVDVEQKETISNLKKDKALISGKLLVRLISTVGASLVLIGGTAFVTKQIVDKSHERIVVDDYAKEKEINQENKSVDAKIAYDWRKNNPTKISYENNTITTNSGILKIIGHKEMRDSAGDAITDEKGTNKLEAIICEYENNTDVMQNPVESIISQHIVFENGKITNESITGLEEDGNYTLAYKGENLSLLMKKVKPNKVKKFIFPIVVTNPYEKVVLDIVEPVKITERKQISSNLFQEKASKKDELSSYIFYVGKKSFRIN